jgi:hypothetical protein
MSDKSEHFKTVPALGGTTFKSAGKNMVPHTLAVPIMLTMDKNVAAIGVVVTLVMGDKEIIADADPQAESFMTHCRFVRTFRRGFH